LLVDVQFGLVSENVNPHRDTVRGGFPQLRLLARHVLIAVPFSRSSEDRNWHV
jgi:hypothetical protein